MTSLVPSLMLVDGAPRASSLDITEKFGKRHCDVLRAIQRVMADLPSDFNERNFASVEYTDEKGEKRPAYSLTRGAFSLVVMGFTGKEALAWKVRYIEAFNAMEKELLKKAVPAPRQKRPCKALPTTAAVLDERAQKVQSLVSDVKERGNEFMSSVFTLYNALRLRPVVLDPLVPDLARALEHNLPQFCTAIGMNVSALSDMLEVYGATLKAAK